MTHSDSNASVKHAGLIRLFKNGAKWSLQVYSRIILYCLQEAQYIHHLIIIDTTNGDPGLNLIFC